MNELSTPPFAQLVNKQLLVLVNFILIPLILCVLGWEGVNNSNFIIS